MFKLVIMDDEPTVLNGLSTYFDWDSYGWAPNVQGNPEQAGDHIKRLPYVTSSLISEGLPIDNPFSYYIVCCMEFDRFACYCLRHDR
jgi:hypothetical protein